MVFQLESLIQPKKVLYSAKQVDKILDRHKFETVFYKFAIKQLKKNGWSYLMLQMPKQIKLIFN